MSQTIQLRHGSAAQWTTANSVLASGEVGVETDTGKHKVGNGSATWTVLGYAYEPLGAVANETSRAMSIEATKVNDLIDVTVSASTAQLALGVTSNVVSGGSYTSPAVPSTVGTPAARFAIKVPTSVTTNVTLAYPNSAGTTVTDSLLPGSSRIYRQKSTSGWGVEAGNTEVSVLSGIFAPVSSVRSVSVLDFGAVGDDATDCTTAIANAIVAVAANGGGTVYFPNGTYRHTGITLPNPGGGVRLQGENQRTTVIRNTDASNASITMHGSFDQSTTIAWARGAGVRDMQIDTVVGLPTFHVGGSMGVNAYSAPDYNVGQVGLDIYKLVNFDIDRVVIAGHDVGIQHVLSWGTCYRDVSIWCCNTGFSIPNNSMANATSTPQTILNMDIRKCTVGMQIDNSVAMAMIGGTIAVCNTGLIIGTGRTNSFYGIQFEEMASDYIVIGVSGETPVNHAFFGCNFVAHTNKSRFVWHQSQDAAFYNCNFAADNTYTATIGIQHDTTAGALSLDNPTFSNVTASISKTENSSTVAYSFTYGVGRISSIGYVPGVKRWGAGSQSSAPLVKSITSNSMPTVNTDQTELASITALATNITDASANLSGTPQNGQSLRYRILDNGTSRTINWGTKFGGSTANPLPTATTAGVTLEVNFIYDAVAAFWVCRGGTVSSGSTQTGAARASYKQTASTVTPSATAATYGTAIVLSPESGYVGFTVAAITWHGSGGGTSSETLTMQLTATYDDASTQSVTLATVAGNVVTVQSGGDGTRLNLMKDGHYVTSMQCQLQSTAPSSAATGTVTVGGANIA